MGEDVLSQSYNASGIYGDGNGTLLLRRDSRF
jgi:hypothetical protein